jgi:hypothetical protein
MSAAWCFDMTAAPRDSTLLLLLLANDRSIVNPLEDTAGLSRTVGHNNRDHDGEDVWMMAGWSWSHDHYTEGRGTPVAWMRYPETRDAESSEHRPDSPAKHST